MPPLVTREMVYSTQVQAPHLQFTTSSRLLPGDDLLQLQHSLLHSNGIYIDQTHSMNQLLQDEERTFLQSRLSEQMDRLCQSDLVDQRALENFSLLDDLTKPPPEMVSLHKFLNLLALPAQECYSSIRAFWSFARAQDKIFSLEQAQNEKQTLKDNRREHQAQLKIHFGQLVEWLHRVYFLQEHEPLPAQLASFQSYQEQVIAKSIIQRNVLCYQIMLCLGGQQKYSFKVELVLQSLEGLMQQQERDIANSQDTLLNFYSPHQTASLHFLNLKQDKLRPWPGLKERLQANTDLLFPSLKEQVQDIKNKAVLSNLTMNYHDLVVTRHSNLGGISFLYSLVSSGSPSECPTSQYRRVFHEANLNGNHSLLFPLELFLAHQTGDTLNLKEFGDCLLLVLRLIKQQLNELAFSFPRQQSLRRVLILLPDHYENSMQLYEKSKELLKNAFE